MDRSMRSCWVLWEVTWYQIKKQWHSLQLHCLFGLHVTCVAYSHQFHKENHYFRFIMTDAIWMSDGINVKNNQDEHVLIQSTCHAIRLQYQSKIQQNKYLVLPDLWNSQYKHSRRRRVTLNQHKIKISFVPLHYRHVQDDWSLYTHSPLHRYQQFWLAVSAM